MNGCGSGEGKLGIREASNLSILLDETQGVSLSDNEDEWRWLLDSSETFYVSSV